MGPRELVVVTDKQHSIRTPDDIAGASVEIVDWSDTRRLSSVGDSPLLIDLDLRNLSKVMTVKDSLSNRRHGQCLIVAVDRSSHLSEAQAYGLGATNLLQRPLNIEELGQILHRHFGPVENEPGGASVASAGAALEGLFSSLTVGGPLQLNEIAKAGDQVMDAIAEIGIEPWLDSVRRHHEGTFQHCLLVTGVATAFGQRYGMRTSDVSTLTLAGLLHDIGKAQIPLEILNKPEKLSDQEFRTIQKHPAIGYDYLFTQGVSRDIADAVRHHHEYLDGSGYPDALPGHEIKDLTRILTICDVYGALIERRAYKMPKSPEQAMEILTNMATKGKVEGDLVQAFGNSIGVQR
jgi:putative nucleotidyltransferase with HDIG domain